MPILDYECDACHHIEEYIIMNESDVPKHCDKCGSEQLHKIISGTVHHKYNAGGFYKTDHQFDKVKLAPGEKLRPK